MEFPTILAFILVCFVYTAVEGQNEDNYRLPNTVKPDQYKIDITLGEDFHETKSFIADVEIVVQISEATTTIILNSIDIVYADVTIVGPDAEYTCTVEYVTDYERIILTTLELPAGTYTLIFKNYTGKLHEDMYGFYLSSYKAESGETEHIATTQLQSTYARRAFPSFDEPSFKATFIISIGIPEGYTALANTAEESSVESSEGKRVTFTETPIMSTYLVAFIVSKFKAYGNEYPDESSSDYNVWCREEGLSTANYSNDIGPKLLERLSDYTGIPYYEMEGVNKMDQVAIPDFAAGAMENWGLVTYRETALLWDSEESTRGNLQRVATVIAHEFTHMWFGDLVTLDWWAYTWLNEGFARYYQYFITLEVHPDWELEKQFVIEQQQVIFASDALAGAAPLNKEASTPEEISNKFASISYNKGASVIRMMANFLGEDNYHEGIKQYLKNHEYNTTTPDYLFTDLSAFAPADLPAELSTIMDSWTNKGGFPTVTVSRTDTGLVLKQERFLFDTAATSDTTWYVPITYTTQQEQNFKDTSELLWLLPTQDLEIPLETQTGWVIVNLNETGYYRVNYDKALWDALETALKDDLDVFPDLNRAQIIDDALNLARANVITYSRALNITTYLKNEDSYYPWYAAFTAFNFLRRRLDSSEYVGETLELHIATMMEKLQETLSFEITETMSHVGVLKAALVLQWACQLNLPACVKEADALFQGYRTDTIIDPNIRSTVYCSAIRQAETNENWEFLWDKFQNTNLATEQNIILTALGCSKDEEILNRYLMLSIDETSGIRKQDANTAFTAVLSGNQGNVDIAFRFLRDNVEDVVGYYEGMNALSSVINGIADRLTTQEQIDEFQTFVTENSDILKDAVLQAETALETASANLAWVEANKQEIEDWLRDVYDSAASVTLSLSLFAVTLTTVLMNSFN